MTDPDLPVAPAQRPDYGIDAPRVVATLALVSAVSLTVAIAAVLQPWSDQPLIESLAWMGFCCAPSFGATAAFMLWTSKVGKVRGRERLLDLVPWRGDEQVLDVGCGRGLLLIGAARRLTTGKATGIDLWQAEDLTGNRPEATLANARLEGVAERVQVETGDMRQLPFPADAFDVIVSCAAIHNLYKAEERDKALDEIARVLKPGGRVVIDDIEHCRQYAKRLGKNGLVDLRWERSVWGSVVMMLSTFGAKRPAALVARKPERVC